MAVLPSTYENLVFEGGGPKDAAFAGAIEILSQHGLYDDIRLFNEKVRDQGHDTVHLAERRG